MCSTEESELCDWRLGHVREFSDLTGWEEIWQHFPTMTIIIQEIIQ